MAVFTSDINGAYHTLLESCRTAPVQLNSDLLGRRKAEENTFWLNNDAVYIVNNSGSMKAASL